MMGMLKQISATPSSRINQLETQIYYAFGTSGNLNVEGRTLEQVLLEVLEKRGMKKWWDPFQKDILKDSSIGAICDALGKIGTSESIDILNKLKKSVKSPLIPKLTEALKKIGERTAISSRKQK